MPSSPDPIVDARCAAARGDWAAVVDAAALALAADTNEPVALFLEGIARAELGDWNAAAPPLNRLAGIAPHIKEVHAKRAQVAQMRGDAETLICALRDICRCDPTDTATRAQLAKWAVLFGETDAEDRLFEARAGDPGNSELREISHALSVSVGEVSPAPRRTLLIADKPGVRVAKIGMALRQAGWEAVLLSGSPPPHNSAPSFSAVESYSSPWEAVEKAAVLKPAICHVLSSMQYDTAAALIASRLAPVIVDPYDNVDMLSSDFMDTAPSRRMDRALERSVFSRADGLVCRNLETQVAVRRDGLTFAGPRLFFSDYCWGNVRQREKLSATDGKLHLVYGGTLWLENRNPQGTDHGLLWLAKVATEHGVHLHVYPTIANLEEFENTLADYRAYERLTQFFHLHHPILNHHQFLEEISQYDIGVLIRHSLVSGGQAWQYTPDKHRLSYANKLADYLDANLHFLIAPQHLLSYGLARRLGIGIAATSDIFGAEYWAGIRKFVLKRETDFNAARSHWSLAKNAARLTEFYQRLINNRT